jgi:hypothetical protein
VITLVGQVTGRAMVRPVRLGMVFEPSLEILRQAVEQATLLWGGKYQPFFKPNDLEQFPRMAAGLGVDVLWALDRASASDQAAELIGYRWRGRNEWGPLGAARNFISSRLLGPERLLDSTVHDNWVLPRWESGDPLDDVFRIWFGSYGASDQGINLERDFAARSTMIHIDPEAPLPADAFSWVTPILATGNAIEYTGTSPGAGFMVVNTSDPTDLMALWNLRAYGAKVFPWPEGQEGRVIPAAKVWLQHLLDVGELSRWQSGDGKPLGPRIYIWLMGDLRGPSPSPAEPPSPLKPPKSLAGFLAGAGVTPMTYPSESVHEFAYGWQGDHPFVTNFSHNFSQPIEPDERTINIPVPKIEGASEPRERPRGDIMAIQLEINSATGERPDWTFSIPNVRKLASLLADYDGALLHFDRPTADGRALSISSSEQTVPISAVPSIVIFNKLIEAGGWSGLQTPGGVFLTRLIERLGGLVSTIANQPGARAGLIDAARSQRGRPSGAIVQYIRKYQGSWPSPFVSSELRSNYPGQVFRYLLAKGILRPVFPVACPHCTTSTAVRPEDLATQMKCEMCLQDFPLGLALGISGSRSHDWLYQLAGHIDQRRLSEALPVMATLQMLASYRYLSPSIVPCVLGWTVRGPGLDCEVDIAVVAEERGLPIVIVGEAKHHLDSIDANDLNNLRRIQDHIREIGVECFILTAILRDLRQEEIDALRDFASRPPRNLPFRSSIEPVLPIVLTEKDLSVTQLDEQHPMRWAPSEGMVGLAKESCRRNLGMLSLDNAWDNGEFYFRPRWPQP